jgi:hypothetical protein
VSSGTAVYEEYFRNYLNRLLVLRRSSNTLIAKVLKDFSQPRWAIKSRLRRRHAIYTTPDVANASLLRTVTDTKIVLRYSLWVPFTEKSNVMLTENVQRLRLTILMNVPRKIPQSYYGRSTLVNQELSTN